MIPQETVNLIVDTARIEEVVGDFVTLKRRGASFVACCPFHNEKTPSFYVTPSKGIFKCFGCGKAGSAVGFVMEHEHCSYVEALRYLAQKYHIEIKEEELSADEIVRRQHRESLLLVSDFAQQFYVSQLQSPEGRALGYRYLQGRGVTDDTIRRFGLGWAPSGRTALLDAATAAGYKLEYLVDAGLVVRHEDGTCSDKFRERVLFPIHSLSGRVIAYSGRTLRSDNPVKYLNSPDTEIYTKGRILLGIWEAKAEIARQDKCILVEGNLDMVTLHQLGITNVVASCGTALTVEQIRLIHKFTENITMMYDGDAAGIHAAMRGINLVLAEGLNVKIVLLPEGEDPDSFSRKHTLAEVQAFLAEGERDFIGCKSELLLAEAGEDPLKKAALINDIADTIAQIPDAVKRAVYVETTAVRFGIESGILFDRIAVMRRKMQEEARREASRSRRDDTPAAPSQEPDAVPQEAGVPEENRTLARVEQDLLYLLLRHGCDTLEFESDSPHYISEEEKWTVAGFIRNALQEDGSHLSNSAYRKVYEAYGRLYDEGLDAEGILHRLLNDPDVQVARLSAQLSTEKYPLTVQRFAASLTATASWLVQVVPKSIFVYHEKRIQVEMDRLRRSLATATAEQQTEILNQLKRLQTAQRKARRLSGREKMNDRK
ncbi:MAG: DNA primase [Bacteroidales bacterium]|nr:DNA primase [Bacteroidales bacterium]